MQIHIKANCRRRPRAVSKPTTDGRIARVVTEAPKLGLVVEKSNDLTGEAVDN
jgi:hypothetical protein